MKYLRFLLSVMGLSVAVAGCMSAKPESGPQNDIHFLRQRPSDAPDMKALFEGRLVLSKRCLYIQGESVNPTNAAIWPFEFSLTVRGESIQILNGDKEVVARVGDRIRVSGGETPQLPLKDIKENFIGTATQCTAPYWIIDNDVEVVAP